MAQSPKARTTQSQECDPAQCDYQALALDKCVMIPPNIINISMKKKTVNLRDFKYTFGGFMDPLKSIHVHRPQAKKVCTKDHKTPNTA